MARSCTDKEVRKIRATLLDEIEMIMFKWPSIENSIAVETYEEKLLMLRKAARHLSARLVIREAQDTLARKASRMAKW